MLNIDIGYITDNRISERKLAELFIDEGETFTLEDQKIIDRIGKVIKGASSLANGYCMSRYSDVMPFDPIPEVVKELRKW